MPKEQWFVMTGEPEPVGPVVREAIERGLAMGLIPKAALVARAGDEQWLPITEVFVPAGASAGTELIDEEVRTLFLARQEPPASSRPRLMDEEEEPQRVSSPSRVVTPRALPLPLQPLSVPQPSRQHTEPSSVPVHQNREVSVNHLLPAQPSAPPFALIAETPLRQLLGYIQAASDQREFLDRAHPQLVLKQLYDGVAQARGVYVSVLSRTTQNHIEALLTQAQQHAQHGMAMWRAVDEAERTGDIEALAAGFDSKETDFGVEVGGALFGAWGSLIGGALGGMLAGHRVAEEIQRRTQQYTEWFLQWLGYLFSQFETQIDPSVALDLQGRQGPAAAPRKPWPKWLLPVVLGAIAWCIIGVLGVVYLRSQGEDPRKEAEGRTDAEAKKIAPDPKVERARSLAGTWRSNRGDDFMAIAREGSNNVVFTLIRGASGSPYPDGEQAFSVQVDGGGSLLPVELIVRPSLPANVKLDGDAQRRCRETWTKIGDQRLVAQFEGDRLLIVDGVKISVTPNGLENSNGKITGCKPFDASKAVRVPWTLAR